MLPCIQLLAWQTHQEGPAQPHLLLWRCSLSGQKLYWWGCGFLRSQAHMNSCNCAGVTSAGPCLPQARMHHQKCLLSVQGQTPVTPLPGSEAGPEAATLLQVVLARIARCLEGPSSPPLICGACKAAGADLILYPMRPCHHSSAPRAAWPGLVCSMTGIGQILPCTDAAEGMRGS